MMLRFLTGINHFLAAYLRAKYTDFVLVTLVRKDFEKWFIFTSKSCRLTWHSCGLVRKCFKEVRPEIKFRVSLIGLMLECSFVECSTDKKEQVQRLNI